MNTPGARIQSLINHYGLSKNAFAQRIGVSSTVINGIVKDAHKPGSKILDAIKKEYPDVSTDWLLTGDGGMFRDDSMPAEDSYLREHLKMLEGNFTRLAAQLEAKDQQLVVKDNQIASLTRMLELALGKSNGVAQSRIESKEGKIIPLYREVEEAV